MLFDAYKTLLGLYADMTASTMDITALIESKIRAVAGIGALVYIFSRLIPQVMRSESIDFFPYLRPFMLMVLIGLSPRICNGIDKLGESIRTAVERQNGTLYEKIAEQTKLLQQTVDAKWQEIGEHPELFRQVDPTFDRSGGPARCVRVEPETEFCGVLGEVQVRIALLHPRHPAGPDATGRVHFVPDLLYVPAGVTHGGTYRHRAGRVSRHDQQHCRVVW
ncbi:MAG: hypothetical protein LH609_13460 [Rudanella sp.]|nr:hypothetical protein [Rudanella sp.]